MLCDGCHVEQSNCLQYGLWGDFGLIVIQIPMFSVPAWSWEADVILYWCYIIGEVRTYWTVRLALTLKKSYIATWAKTKCAVLQKCLHSVVWHCVVRTYTVQKCKTAWKELYRLIKMSTWKNPIVYFSILRYYTFWTRTLQKNPIIGHNINVFFVYIKTVNCLY